MSKNVHVKILETNLKFLQPLLNISKMYQAYLLVLGDAQMRARAELQVGLVELHRLHAVRLEYILPLLRNRHGWNVRRGGLRWGL